MCHIHVEKSPLFQYFAAQVFVGIVPRIKRVLEICSHAPYLNSFKSKIRRKPKRTDRDAMLQYRCTANSIVSGQYDYPRSLIIDDMLIITNLMR